MTKTLYVLFFTLLFSVSSPAKEPKLMFEFQYFTQFKSQKPILNKKGFKCFDQKKDQDTDPNQEECTSGGGLKAVSFGSQTNHSVSFTVNEDETLTAWIKTFTVIGGRVTYPVSIYEQPTSLGEWIEIKLQTSNTRTLLLRARLIEK